MRVKNKYDHRRIRLPQISRIYAEMQVKNNMIRENIFHLVKLNTLCHWSQVTALDTSLLI